MTLLVRSRTRSRQVFSVPGRIVTWMAGAGTTGPVQTPRAHITVRVAQTMVARDVKSPWISVLRSPVMGMAHVCLMKSGHRIVLVIRTEPVCIYCALFVMSRGAEGPGREILQRPPPPPVCLSVCPSRLVFAL